MAEILKKMCFTSKDQKSQFWLFTQTPLKKRLIVFNHLVLLFYIVRIIKPDLQQKELGQ